MKAFNEKAWHWALLAAENLLNDMALTRTTPDGYAQRDWRMAKNVEEMQAFLSLGKVMIWAHSYHLMKDRLEGKSLDPTDGPNSKSMGAELKNFYGDNYRLITFNSKISRYTDIYDNLPNQAAMAPEFPNFEPSVEGRVSGLGKDIVLVDIKNSTLFSDDGKYLTRVLYSFWSDLNPLHQYDGIFFMQESQASMMSCGGPPDWGCPGNPTTPIPF